MAEKEYLVGTVRPTNRPEAGQELDLDTLIPAKIKFLSSTMNFTRGTEEEFSTSMPGYEAKAAEFAKMGADLVRPSGAPPFMLLGYQKEQELIASWEKKYGVPMFTSGQNHVKALRTLGMKKFVGATYFPEKMNNIFAQVFHRCRIRSAGDGRHRRALRGRAESAAGTDFRIHEESRGQAQKHRRHLYARLSLENRRDRRSPGKRHRVDGSSRRTGARLGNPALSRLAPSDQGLRPAARRDAG